MTISLFFNNKISKTFYKNLENDFEILFECEELSKFGKIKYNALKTEVKSIKTNAKKILNADLFFRGKEFDKKISLFTADFVSLFDAIRCEDLGLSYFLKEHFPEKKLQIILENFCHNKLAIKTIQSEFGSLLEKIIISSELEKDEVKNLIDENINIEILLFGEVLIFQTPRKLLDSNKSKFSLLNSKELPDHKNLKFLSNKNGCFIFNSKSFSLLQNIDELKKINVKNFRIDTRLLPLDKEKEVYKYLLEKKSLKDLEIANETSSYFFFKNDSDLLFSNLKKKSFANLPLAEVIATYSSKWAVIYTYKDFLLDNISLKYKIGQGEEYDICKLEAFNIDDKEIKTFKKNNIYTIKWLKKISVGTLIEKK